MYNTEYKSLPMSFLNLGNLTHLEQYSYKVLHVCDCSRASQVNVPYMLPQSDTTGGRNIKVLVFKLSYLGPFNYSALRLGNNYSSI